MFERIYEFLRSIFISTNTPIYDSMILQLNDIQAGIREVKEELKFEKEFLLKELRKKDLIISAMIENLPDMLWFKDPNGKYMFANKAIRENLLFDDKPEGKTDIELAKAAKVKFGEREHTFGETCGNSDQDALEIDAVNGKRYVESGKIRGKMTHLEVNKSVVKLDGEVIGVVGSGRDITEYREALHCKGYTDVFAVNEFSNKDE